MNRLQLALAGASALLPAFTSATTVAATFTTLHTFTLQEASSFPFTGVVVLNNILYGTTLNDSSSNRNGTVYKIDLATNVTSTLYTFKGGTADGTEPSQLAVLNGQLYGTTLSGGLNGTGIIFKVDPATGTETVLHSFEKSNTPRTFSYLDPLVVRNGVLYGTIGSGGSKDLGVVFSITPAGVYTKLHNFNFGAGGCIPDAGVVANGSILYGTTDSCGANSSGTVYSLDVSSGVFTTLYTVPHGHPNSRVIYANNALFGTISSGGVNFAGSVYKIDLVTGTYASLYDFTRTETNIPADGVTYFKGKLYGVVGNDISGDGVGEAYSVDATTGAKQDIPFTGNNSSPFGNLYVYKGSLYGTTSDNNFESSNTDGTVYALTP